MYGEYWIVVGVDISNVVNNVVGFNVKGGDGVFVDSIVVGFIEEFKYLDDRSVFGLSNELCECMDVVEGLLSVSKVYDIV